MLSTEQLSNIYNWLINNRASDTTAAFATQTVIPELCGNGQMFYDLAQGRWSETPYSPLRIAISGRRWNERYPIGLTVDMLWCQDFPTSVINQKPDLRNDIEIVRYFQGDQYAPLRTLCSIYYPSLRQALNPEVSLSLRIVSPKEQIPGLSFEDNCRTVARMERVDSIAIATGPQKPKHYFED